MWRILPKLGVGSIVDVSVDLDNGLAYFCVMVLKSQQGAQQNSSQHQYNSSREELEKKKIQQKSSSSQKDGGDEQEDGGGLGSYGSEDLVLEDSPDVVEKKLEDGGRNANGRGIAGGSIAGREDEEENYRERNSSCGGQDDWDENAEEQFVLSCSGRGEEESAGEIELLTKNSTEHTDHTDHDQDEDSPHNAASRTSGRDSGRDARNGSCSTFSGESSAGSSAARPRPRSSTTGDSPKNNLDEDIIPPPPLPTSRSAPAFIQHQHRHDEEDVNKKNLKNNIDSTEDISPQQSTSLEKSSSKSTPPTPAKSSAGVNVNKAWDPKSAGPQEPQEGEDEYVRYFAQIQFPKGEEFSRGFFCAIVTNQITVALH